MSARAGSRRFEKGPRRRGGVRAGARLAQLDEIEVTVEKLVAGGEGLARIEGIPIFVPRSAPGDRLRVRLVERRPDYGRAEILQILVPGSGRRDPPCPHFSRCGGCDLQHLEDDLQVRLKVSALRETLGRLGGVDERVPIAVVKSESWGYRLRAQLHSAEVGGLRALGYRSRRSHEIVPIDSCPILAPDLEIRLRALAHEPPADLPRRLDLLVGDDGSLSTAPVTPPLPHGAIRIAVGEFTYELDARCFFQAHRQLLGELVERVVGDWLGTNAVDLYAGVGLFSLPLARRFERVTAVEGDRVSVRFARRNARRYRLDNLELVTRAVESWIDRLPGDLDRVVVDPPRAGLTTGVRQTLCRRPPRRLTYVSCHPATFARDLKDLTAVFRIEGITILDMFPQTGHVEAVVQLVR